MGEASTETPIHVHADGGALARTWVVAMLAGVAMLFLADAWLNHAHALSSGALRRFFNMTREDGLGSWVAVTQTAVVALVLWAHVITARAADQARSTQLGWTILAVFFTYMAFDDGTMFHERIGTWVNEAEAVERDVGGGFPTYAWQAVFVPLFGVMGVYLLVFSFREFPDAVSRALVVGAVATLGVAVVMDFFEGMDRDDPANPYAWLTADRPTLEAWTRATFDQSPYAATVHFSKSLEECLEILANALLGALFLRKLLPPGRTITVTSPER